MARDKTADGANGFMIRAEYVYAGPNNERLSETLDFPAQAGAVERLLENAGINGADERIFFAESYESPIYGLSETLDEIEDGITPDELNTLAKKLADLDERGRSVFAAALELHRYDCDVEGLNILATRLEAEPDTGKALKRNLEGYEELFAVKLDGIEEIVAIKPGTDMPYMLCDASRNNPLGIETYSNGIVSDDYLEIMREFTRRLNVRLNGLDLGRRYRGSTLDDYPLTAADCVPGGMDADLTDKVVIIKPESLAPEYRSLSFQLSLATSGFGCKPDARGRAVYCTELYSGEQSRWDRSDILGVASDEVIPKWARLKLTALTEKRPVMDKELFWRMIDDAREKAGRWQDMRTPLVTMLSALEPADILRWGQIFDEYQALSYKNGLWATASVMLGGCSDDGFDYFRGWLTAQGKDVFLKALADPESLADLETVQAFGHETVTLEFTPPDGYVNEAEFESMLSVAADAYEGKTGGDYYDKIGENPLSDKGKADIAGEITYAPDIDVRWFNPDADREGFFKEQSERFPRLYRLFNEDTAADLAQTAPAPPQKESVMKQIREAKTAPKQPRKPKTPGKSHSEEL